MFYDVKENHAIRTVYDKEQLVEAVGNTIDYYEEENDRLRARNKELSEAAQEIVRKDYEDEIERLENELKMSYGAFASEKEKQAYNEFVQKHMHDRRTSRYNGGRIPYLIPNYFGIGRGLQVVCQICGESEEITDTEVW